MSIWMLIFLFIFSILILANLWIVNRKDKRALRDIPALDHMRSSMENSVEDGTCIHIAVGRSEVTSPEIAVGLIGLNLLKRISYITADSDRPPIASAGTGSMMLLSQDAIRNIYTKIGQPEAYSTNYGRFQGPTPFSYAAGAAITLKDEGAATNLLVGNFGVEAGLLTHAGERNKVLTVAGTNDILGQAIIYATAHEPLIGEEVFASGAYFGTKGIHRASLLAQDAIRILIIIGITAASLLGLIKGFIQ